MSDIEIISAFLADDQRAIGEAYMAWREPFRLAVTSRTHLDELYLDDAYHEAFIRLQQHILTGRLTPDNLQHSLLAYIKEIGYYTALELIRGRRELPVSYLAPADDDACNDAPEAELAEGDDAPEAPDAEPAFDPEALMIEQERERIIREEVYQLGQPCAPLLLGFIWDHKSMETLALELGYKNADSAKAQKAKCMKKVKSFIRQRLISYGYGI